MSVCFVNNWKIWIIRCVPVRAMIRSSRSRSQISLLAILADPLSEEGELDEHSVLRRHCWTPSTLPRSPSAYSGAAVRIKVSENTSENDEKLFEICVNCGAFAGGQFLPRIVWLVRLVDSKLANLASTAKVVLSLCVCVFAAAIRAWECSDCK